MALHVLLTDTLGSGGVLLDYANATRAAIEAWFQKLAGYAPDDEVVVTFSGHCSTTFTLRNSGSSRSSGRKNRV
jgi:hypothetical protein